MKCYIGEEYVTVYSQICLDSIFSSDIVFWAPWAILASLGHFDTTGPFCSFKAILGPLSYAGPSGLDCGPRIIIMSHSLEYQVLGLV